MDERLRRVSRARFFCRHKDVLKRLLFAILLLPVSAGAQYQGVSSHSILASSYPCSDKINIDRHARQPAATAVVGSFGKDWSCLSRWISHFSRRNHLLEVFFSNEACRRHPEKTDCERGDFLPSVSVGELNNRLERKDPATIQAAQLWAGDILAHVEAIKLPTTTLILATGLEDNFTDKAYRVLAQSIREIWPYLIIRNPVGGKGHASALERHGAKARCGGAVEIKNEDGDEHFSSRKFLKDSNCFASFLWRPKHQGRTGNWQSIPRSKRKFTIPYSDIVELSELFKETRQ